MIQIIIEKLDKYAKLLLKIFIVILVLNIIVITIGALTGHNSMKGLLDVFEISGEDNLGAYFSSINLLTASLLLFIIYKYHKNNGISDSRYWLVLSIIFLALSIDETVCLHELLVAPIRDYFHIEHLFYFAWVIPGMIICVILAAYFLKFYLSLPARYKRLFGISAFLLIGGAIGIEIIDGYIYSLAQERNLAYILLTTLEEAMEMLGIIIFIYSLIDYLKSDIKPGQLVNLTEKREAL